MGKAYIKIVYCMEKPPTDITSQIKDPIKEPGTFRLFLLGMYTRHLHGDWCFINARDKWSQETAANSSKY